MTLAYIVAGAFAIMILSAIYFKMQESKTPYFKIKNKLKDDLLQANFSNDWKKIQEINLQLLWLKVICDVEESSISDIQKKGSEVTHLSSLKESKIKFPLHFEFDSIYHFPFAKEIVNVYGNTLVENDYSTYKPESILPFPKKTIIKAIDFMSEYLTYENALYEIIKKEELVDNFKICKYILIEYFVDSSEVELPKNGLENFRIGKQLKERRSI